MYAARAGGVVLITGATRGLGKACAEKLAEAGWRVYGTGRMPPAEYSGSYALIGMDVTDDRSVRDAVDGILAREGRIDAVVCNAGYGIAGSVEETPLSEAKAQFETVFFGTLRTIQAVLPSMRKAGQGYILVVGSMAGLAAIPFQPFYSAAKFALEGLVEALRIETRRFGVRCAILDPGDFRTGFTDARRRTDPEGSPYREYLDRSLGVMESEERKGADPADLARLVVSLLGRDDLRVRYLAGSGSQRLAMVLKRILPSRIFEKILSAHYRI